MYVPLSFTRSPSTTRKGTKSWNRDYRIPNYHNWVSYDMTFKDLQKLVQSQSEPEHFPLSQRLRDKPFWIWNQHEHRQKDIRTKGDCCFNHILGLPKKDGNDMPLLPYQKTL